MNGQVFRAEGLVKSFRRNQVLRGFDLDLEPGQVTLLLGKNGSGKTTLLKLALGVLPLDRGTLEVFGLDPRRHARSVRREIGYVPSEPDVPGWMTLVDLCRYLAPQYPTWSQARAKETAESLDLPMDRPFRSLSRGEAMKSLLVVAVAPAPRLLLLDEPFAGLDPLAREEVLRGVLGQLRVGDQTVLCATHDLELAVRLADRVALLAEGKVAAYGSLDEIAPDGATPAGVLETLRRVTAKEEAGRAEVELPCRC